MDLQILETGNGGDAQLMGNDFAIVSGVENMPYLGMFGGSDWWGNDVLLDSDDLRFSAETEALLLTVPLNSQGRVTIENAVKRDLAFLLDDVPDTKLNVDVTITSDNRISIFVNFGGSEFYYLWNPATLELTFNNPQTISLLNDDDTPLLNDDGHSLFNDN